MRSQGDLFLKDYGMESESKTTLTFATIGSLTERGGRVSTATSGLTLGGLAAATVGDIVTYIVQCDDQLNTHLSCTAAPISPGVSAAVCKPDSDKRII